MPKREGLSNWGRRRIILTTEWRIFRCVWKKRRAQMKRTNFTVESTGEEGLPTKLQNEDKFADYFGTESSVSVVLNFTNNVWIELFTERCIELTAKSRERQKEGVKRIPFWLSWTKGVLFLCQDFPDVAWKGMFPSSFHRQNKTLQQSLSTPNETRMDEMKVCLCCLCILRDKWQRQWQGN